MISLVDAETIVQEKLSYPSVQDIQRSLVDICDLIIENNTRLLSLEHSLLEIDEMINYKDEKINLVQTEIDTLEE